MGNAVKILFSANIKPLLSSLSTGSNALKGFAQSIKGMNLNLSGFDKAGNALKSLSEPFKAMHLNLPGLGPVSEALTSIKDTAASIVMPGFDYTKEMESSQVGIAGMLQSMTLMNGEAMSFGEAMGISSDLMKSLQKDALLTSATAEELTASFKELMGPGLNAGLKLDEIEKLTAKGVNAGKSIGMDSGQATEELRAILQGDIGGEDSKLAEVLGITEADIAAAKQSSEGLFAYLMEHMQAFDEVGAHFPDTLEGKLSHLEEVGKLASAKFTEVFEPEIKECLDFVADSIGEVNAQTGELEINAAILEFIYDLKAGWQDLTAFVADVLPSNGSLINDLTGTVGALYRSVCNVTSGFMDFLRVMYNSDLIKGFNSLIREVANEIEWLTKKFRIFYDERAKSMGYKESRNTGVADGLEKAAENAKQNLSSNTGAVTINPQRQSDDQAKREAADAKRAVEQAERERIRQSQDTMKQMLDYWKNQLNAIQRDFKVKQDSLKLQFDQGFINSDEYYTQKAQQEIERKTAELKNIDEQIQTVQNASFTSDSDKRNQLEALQTRKQILYVEQQELILVKGQLANALEGANSNPGGPDTANYTSRYVYEAVLEHQKAREPAVSMLKQYSEMIGDYSKYQYIALDDQYAEIKKQLENYPKDIVMQNARAVIDKVYANKKLRIDFAKTQRDLEIANTSMIDGQARIFAGVTDGTVSAGAAVQEYGRLCKTYLDPLVKELETQLSDPGITDEVRREIEDKLKQIQKNLQSGFAGILKSIDDKLQQEIAAINANSNLTKMQKEDLIEESTRHSNLEKAKAAQANIDRLQNERPDNYLEQIAGSEKQRDMFLKLAELPSLFAKIEQAGKQALENGLFTFFSSGINECKNLSEAFQNLGKSILQSIQQVLADQLTRQFMSMLLPGFLGGGKAAAGIQGNAKGGKIVGPGTGTSDSILSWLSNGEYVVKAESVRRFGTKFFDYINHGMVPPDLGRMNASYALGNAMGVGAADYTATNSVNVPVNVNGFGVPSMTSELRNGIEETVVRIMRKYS